MAKAKIYRTIIQYEILSPEPIVGDNLQWIAMACEDGDCSGRFLDDIVSNEELIGEVAAAATLESGSDTEFFQMDENGDELE